MTATAADLDGTLVFTADSAAGTVVQRYSSGRTAVVHRDVPALLARWGASPRSLVATTRTLEEYRALALPPVRRALVANGLCLVVDGTPDGRWRAHVADHLDGVAAGWAEVVARVGADWRDLGLVPQAKDTHLAVALGDRAMLPSLAAALAPRLSPWGWGVATSGRKLYLLPEALDKGFGVARALDWLGLDGYRAAGDSTMDAGLLVRSRAGLVPAGSDLGAGLREAHVAVTSSPGVPAGLEVARWLLEPDGPVGRR